MNENDAHGNEHWRRRWARLRRPGLLAAALACLAFLAAACSSPPSAANGAGSAAASGKHSMLAYARCMRAHGVTAFPDPNSQGQLSLNAAPGTGLDPNSPQYKAADSACKSLMPPPAPVDYAKAKAGNLKYAECMRAHKITSFPDPNSQGVLQVQVKPGSNLDPNNPQYQAANRACQHLQYNPKGVGAPGLSSRGVGGK